MPYPSSHYSTDMKNSVINMYTRKQKSFRQIEDLFEPYGPTKSTAQRWVASHPFGQVLLRLVKKEERRGRCSLLHDKEFRSKIDQAINDKPFHSATDLIDFFKKETTMDVNVSSNTMSTWRRRLNYTKKNHVYSFIENDKVRDKRTMFSQQLEANDTWNDVISIDETAIYLKRRKVSGFSKRGNRLRIEYEKGGCERLSLLLAISRKGIVGYELMNGAFNRNAYVGFLKSLNAESGSRILMDNASFTRS